MKISRRDGFFILFSVSLLILTAGSLRALGEYALDWDNTNASQVILIPFVSAALIYFDRRAIFREIRSAVVPGMAVMVVGLGLFVAGRQYGPSLAEGDRLALTTSSLVIVWLGGFLSFYGLNAFRAGLFPLLFLLLSAPIPSPVLDRAIAFLQHGSADMTYILLKLTGTPVFRQGTIFTLPDLVIEVAPQCSGIRSGISLFILSSIAGHLVLRSWWRRGVLLMVALPILILKNALRIGTLSVLAVHVDKSILTSRLHQEGGIPFFVLGLLLIYPILLMLARSEGKGLGVITREGSV